jgi:hypothetical protein
VGLEGRVETLVTVLTVLAAVLAAVSILGWRSWEQYRFKSRPTLSPREVNVLMLGRRESGKTGLIASMWRELAFGGSAGVLVTTDPEGDRIGLGELCKRIEDPENELPDSTPLGDAKRWTFIVKAMNKSGQEKEAFRFSCLDYAGEYVDKKVGDESVLPEFADALDNADIIMGVLDGQKIAHRMAGKPEHDFSTKLRELSEILMKHRQKPLHFIITKWDLLAGKHSLEEVIKDLKEENPFKRLLANPRMGGVRFIPVSSLGLNGFVNEDPDTGKMKKSFPIKPWKPAYVTLPLAYAIPDMLTTDMDRLYAARDEEKASGGEHKLSARRPLVMAGDVSRIFFWVTMALGLSIVAPSAAAVVPQEILLKVSLESLLEKAGKIIRQARNRGVPTRLDDSSALVRALSFLRGEIDHLEGEIPEATLRRVPEVAT